MNLSTQEQQQYSRHLLLDEVGNAGQLKLKNAKVLIVGAGGLGCPVLQYLTAAGVGRVGIIDDDIVAQSNLQRQIVYTQNDVGKSKAVTAVARMQHLNPFIQFDVYNTKLTSNNALEIFKKYDIIVDGTDNFPSRYLINDAAFIANKPLVFGSIHKFSGQVSVFNYKNGPTYRCLFPTPPAPDAVPNCSEIGVLGVLPGIIGSLQANEVLKMILGIGDVLSGKLLKFDALTMKQHILGFQKNQSLKISELQEDYAAFCGIETNIQEISLDSYLVDTTEYTLLDVRNDDERDVQPAKGLHIPLDALEDRWTEIPSNKKLILFCKSGVRSKIGVQKLKAKQFNNTVFSLIGGYDTVLK